jgi:hypothetical protein
MLDMSEQCVLDGVRQGPDGDVTITSDCEICDSLGYYLGIIDGVVLIEIGILMRP